MGSGSTKSVNIIPALTKVFKHFPSERIPEIRFIAAPAFPLTFPRPGLSHGSLPFLKQSPDRDLGGARAGPALVPRAVQ